MIAAAAVLALLHAAQPAPVAFASLDDLDDAVAKVEAGGSADVLWARVRASGPMPLIFGRTAVFFFRGDARSVEWRGDLSGWRPSAATRGRRVGASDLWTWRRDLVPRSRADYKIVVDGDRWMLDPLNPRTQRGGFGPNSEVRMPGWTESLASKRRDGVPRGRLGEPWRLPSASLGHPIDLRVYTPAGYDGARHRYAVLYVIGNEYWEDDMGALVATLDNLVAGRTVRPLVAIFVDDWDRATGRKRDREELVPAADGSCAFCAFLATELVPAVDERYSTLRARSDRALISVSLGGLAAAATLRLHPEVFGAVAFQSPYLGDDPLGVVEGLGRARGVPPRAVVDVGVYEDEYQPVARGLRAELERKGASVLWIEAPDGHSWGHWRSTLAPSIEFLFPLPGDPTE